MSVSTWFELRGLALAGLWLTLGCAPALNCPPRHHANKEVRCPACPPDQPCECPEVWVCRADPDLAEERRLERLRQQQEKERAQAQARDAEQQRAQREAEAAKRRAEEAENLRRAQETPVPATTIVAPPESTPEGCPEPCTAKKPSEPEPVRRAARCRAGPGYCCLEDGTVIRPCGPIGRPGCSQYTSMCGSGDFCHGCRCLPPDALVLTPTGEVALSRLKVGDAVITLTQAGTRGVASVLRLARDPLAGSHQMVVVRLANGRALVGSALHPLADGRTLGQITPGDHLERFRVLAVEQAPYTGDATWDLLPSGETGVYFVAGVPLKSTLLRTFERSK